MFSKIVQRRVFYPVQARAEVRTIDVDVQQLLRGEAALQLNRGAELIEFSLQHSAGMTTMQLTRQLQGIRAVSPVSRTEQNDVVTAGSAAGLEFSLGGK